MLAEIEAQLDRWKVKKDGYGGKLTLIGRLRWMHNRDVVIVRRVRHSEALTRKRLEELEALLPQALYGRGPQRSAATERLKRLIPE